MAQGLKRQLGLGDGTVFALSSVVGSGILFLPSLVYALAGRDSLVVWLGAGALALPLLLIMNDMVKRVSDGSGIAGFIALGLGDFAASSVPWLLLAIMFCGGSGSAYVAGRFIEVAFGGGQARLFAVAFAIAIAATAIPALGFSIGRRIQSAITWCTIGFALAVLLLSWNEASSRSIDPVVPALGELRPILLGIVAAFFAFVGLENLTFIAGEFRHPERDFLTASVIAFSLYLVLLLALTLAFGVLTAQPGAVDPTSGLVGLSVGVGPGLARICALFGVFAVLSNLTSWVWGMSRMVYRAAQVGQLPRSLAPPSIAGVPRRAVLFAGAPYLLGVIALLARPAWTVTFLVFTGAMGSMLYLLALVSYMRITQSALWRLIAGLLVVIIAVSLSGVGLPIAAPLAVAACAYATAAVRRRRLAGP